ncbi:MAG: prepilin-type N-terminal cleavage/methylation domain-containing protein [Candidatus Kerfeldbacteria bacterium]
MKIQKGFTLIELLIVVAIIGLLATLAIVSLTSAQQRARDTKRVADAKAIQTALELYWNANADYPLIPVGKTWTTLGSDVSAYMSAIPVDPDHDTGTYYDYLLNGTNNDQYYIGVILENSNHSSLNQDVDGSVGGVGWVRLNSNDARTVDANLQCNDPVYCLSGDSTL